MKAALLRISVVLAIFLVSVLFPISASANDPALELYSGGDDPDGLAASQPTNNVFYDHTFTYTYTGGAICLSSKGDTCAPAAIDDAVGIFVDDVQVFYQESDTHDFGPIDFSNKLHIGTNRIRVQLIDLMGPSRGGSALWLMPAVSGSDCIPDCGSILPTGIPVYGPNGPGNGAPVIQGAGMAWPCLGTDDADYPNPPQAEPAGATISIYGNDILWEQPSVASRIILQLQGQGDAEVNVQAIYGPLCYTEPSTGCHMIWEEVKINGIVGWTSDDPCGIYTSTGTLIAPLIAPFLEPTIPDQTAGQSESTEMPMPNAQAQPTQIPAQSNSAASGGALPEDGYEPGLSLGDQIKRFFIPLANADEPLTAAECQKWFTENNCTWYVAGIRPDVCQWIEQGQGNAYQWLDQAQKHGSLLVTVKTTPDKGDIAVWSQNCDEAKENGHVAYVTNSYIKGGITYIDVSEVNWCIGYKPNNGMCIPRNPNGIKVGSNLHEASSVP